MCPQVAQPGLTGNGRDNQSPGCTNSDVEGPKDMAEVVTMSRATSVVGQLENTEMEENKDRVDEEEGSEVCTLSIDGDPNDADASPKGCHGGTIRKCYLEKKTSRRYTHYLFRLLRCGLPPFIGVTNASKLLFCSAREQQLTLIYRKDKTFIEKHLKQKAFHLGSNSSCHQHLQSHYDLYKACCAEWKIPEHHHAVERATLSLTFIATYTYFPYLCAKYPYISTDSFLSV